MHCFVQHASFALELIPVSSDRVNLLVGITVKELKLVRIEVHLNLIPKVLRIDIWYVLQEIQWNPYERAGFH